MTIPEASGVFIPEELESVEIGITGVNVEGATELLQKEREEIIQEFLDRESLTLADFYRLAQGVTQVYRRDGYVLTRALIPAQRLGGGDGILRIVEGFISDVVIEKDGEEEWPVSDAKVARVREILEPLIGVVPINVDELERQLLIVSEQAGLIARTIIRPADEPGAAELRVKLSSKPLDLTLQYDAYGTEFTGFSQYTGTVSVNSILSRGEKLTVNWKQGREPGSLRQLALAATVPVGIDGMKLDFSGSRTVSEPGHTLAIADVDSVTREMEFSLSYPFIMSRLGTFRGIVGFRRRGVEVDILQLVDTEDRLNEAFIGFDYDEVNRVGDAVAISFRAARSGGWMRARSENDDLLSRAEADPQYQHYRLDMTRLQNLPVPGFSTQIALSGQYATRPLHASNEFQVGGKDFGRGYDAGEISGDYGAKLKAELIYSPDLSLLKEFPKLNENADLSFYTFYDLGYVRNHDIEDQGDRDGDTTSRISLASWGLGATLSIMDMLDLNFEVAKPATKPVGRIDTHDTEPHRIYASVDFRY